MKRIVVTSLALILLGLSAWMFGAFEAVSAAPKDEICKGVSITGGTCADTSTGGLEAVIKNLLNLFSLIIGIIAVIMIMVSGAKYLTSGGDSGKVKSAKDTLVYAIIGLVVVAFSQVIVQFVLTEAAPTTKENEGEEQKKDEGQQKSGFLPTNRHIENYYKVVL